MRLLVTYWELSCEAPDKTCEVDIEFTEHHDFDFVPYQETEVERHYVEYEVFVYGDIPEEIKDKIRDRFKPEKTFYSGTTENFEFTAE